MADTHTIRKLMEELTSGRMRVPNFQRGFVWDPERVSYLMDSIYKGYPFGSILLWRTKQALTYERNLGPFSLPKNDPSYPTDYILDGQQRVTSIFGVFQTDVKLDDQPLWTRIYFDLSGSENAQDSSFVALEPAEVDPDRYFRVGCLFDPKAYRDETDKYKDSALIDKIDIIQTKFKEAQIPIQTINTEDKTAVAIVFERVNQRGVELDTVQLLSAWTWSGDFDLNQKFEELAVELAPFGFHEVGADKDLLLRCCSAVLTRDPSADSLVNLNGAVVRSRFDEVVTGVKGAIDFLRKNLHVERLENLPYDNILVPLSVFFSGPASKQIKMDDAIRRKIVRWFWRTCFSRRYNSQPIKNMREDVQEIGKAKSGDMTSNIDGIPFNINDKFFIQNNFRINSVLSKTFILMLAGLNPRSFVGGGAVNLGAALKEYNRNEFHHIYPRSYLRNSGQTMYDDSCLANICFLSKSDNNNLGGVAPSVYRSKMPKDISSISASNLLPDSTFLDVYDKFLFDRAKMLEKEALKLLS